MAYLKRWLTGGLPLWQSFWLYYALANGLFLWLALFWGNEQDTALMVSSWSWVVIYYALSSFAVVNSAGRYQGADIWRSLGFFAGISGVFSGVVALVFLIFYVFLLI